MRIEIYIKMEEENYLSWHIQTCIMATALIYEFSSWKLSRTHPKDTSEISKNA